MGVVPAAIGLAVVFAAASSAIAADDGATQPAELRRQRREAAARPRRVIMNNDGNDVRGKDGEPRTHQEFLDQRTTALAGTHVDAIFYCSGVFNLYSHHSEESELRRHRDHGAVDWAWELGNTGPDSLETVVDFGHKNRMEVFWSMRMNDTHDFADPALLAQWKQQHPDYLMGKLEDKSTFVAGARRWSAVNYEIPEVRDKVFRILHDVATRYDVDGLELDFFRHPIYFKPQMAGRPVTQAQRDCMTELMRRVRAMADETAAARGRPMLIAVRVPDSVECSAAIGLDLTQWLEEDLIDLMIVSDDFRLNPWPTSVALGHRYGVPVYPSLSAARPKNHESRRLRASIECYRGRALEAWRAGAAGIYLFNYFNPHGDVFRELGDPDALAAMAQCYPAGVMSARVINYWIADGLQWLRAPAPLPEEPLKLEAGRSGTIDILVAVVPDESADPRPCRVRLMLADAAATAQRPTIKLNNHELAPAEPSGKWIAYAAEAAWLIEGINRLTVAMPSDGDSAIVVDAVIDVPAANP